LESHPAVTTTHLTIPPGHRQTDTDRATTPRDMGSGGDTDAWSVTTAELRAEVRDALAEGREAALATVVDVEGSAYRRPGAGMLVDADGTTHGAITAGCLADPVRDLARSALDDGRALTETFDLTTDEGGWGYGLGCNGVIDVLVEPLDDSFARPLAALDDGEAVAVRTAVESSDPAVSVGNRITLYEDGTVGGNAESTDSTSERGGLPAEVAEATREAAVEARDDGGTTVERVGTDDGAVSVFVHGHQPLPELLLFGSQFDVHPVARFGREVGFRVIVASARGARADADSFPHAHEVVATHPADLTEAISDPQRTYAVLMSHNFTDDQLALTELLETEVPYVGLMGPRKRFDELRDALAADGVDLDPADRERIATPVGLDLGGGEPVQIGMSVVSEVLAVHNGRAGGRLRNVEGPIHPRSGPEAE
jgi:xanthine dehydrogenase accessory factor